MNKEGLKNGHTNRRFFLEITAVFNLRESVLGQVLYFLIDLDWIKRRISRRYGLRMPSFRIRARNVLRLSPRISAAPFFPLTFH